MQKEQAGLRQLIEDCGGRYHAINNRQRQDREQVRQLLDKVRTQQTMIIQVYKFDVILRKTDTSLVVE